MREERGLLRHLARVDDVLLDERWDQSPGADPDGDGQGGTVPEDHPGGPIAAPSQEERCGQVDEGQGPGGEGETCQQRAADVDVDVSLTCEEPACVPTGLVQLEQILLELAVSRPRRAGTRRPGQPGGPARREAPGA